MNQNERDTIWKQAYAQGWRDAMRPRLEAYMGNLAKQEKHQEARSVMRAKAADSAQVAIAKTQAEKELEKMRARKQSAIEMLTKIMPADATPEEILQYLNMTRDTQ